jgi:medium-chain acyl-[acyl-carrier-protein] hydrolase
MPISENFTSILFKDFEINFMQCMPNGLLKYTELCNILQLTASAHSELGGINFIDMQKNNQAWVLSRMRVEIQELPKWKDTITVKTWICNLENSRSIRGFDVLLNGKKIIGSETFWAVFNTKTRRPEGLSLPHEHFEKFPENRATENAFSKVNLSDFVDLQDFEIDKIVRMSDLDIVNHVNNIKYLEWCLDYVDAEMVLNQKLKSFDMNFLKELSLNEKVLIEKFETKNSTFFGIKTIDKTSFALQLNWKLSYTKH